MAKIYSVYPNHRQSLFDKLAILMGHILNVTLDKEINIIQKLAAQEQKIQRS
jgi:hypothetical protein